MKAKYIIALLYLAFIYCAFSQSADEARLFKILANSKDCTQVQKAYFELGQMSINNDNASKSMYYYKRALKLSSDGNDTLQIIEALNKLAAIHSNIGAHNASINYYLDALKLAELSNNEALIAQLHGDLGVMYTDIDEKVKAEIFLNKELEYHRKVNNKKGCAGSYNNLGILYRKLKKYGDAVSYYRESIQICKETGDEKTLMQTSNNLAYLHALQGDTIQALEEYFKSLEIANKLGDKFQQGLVLENIGSTYHGLRDDKKAIQYFEKGLQICEGIGDLIGVSSIHQGLADVFERMKQPEKALMHYKAYLHSRDSLEQFNNEKERQRTEMKHEYEKEKLLLIKEQEKRDQVTQAVSKKQQQIIYSVTVSLIIVAILLVFLYQRFKLTKTQKTIIEYQKKTVEVKQKEILDSINYAKRIQDSLLDEIDPGNKFFSDSFILFKPKDIVSGDFYWHTKKMISEKISDTESAVKELFFIAACDSTGHGVPGGFMSLLNIAYISEAINEKNILEPNKVFDHVRTRLINSISKNEQKDGFDGVLVCIEKKSVFKNKTVSYTNTKLSYAAAFNAPLIVRNNQIENLGTDKMPVGSGELSSNFTLFSHDLQKDDIIYIYTDGFGDQFGGPKGKKFMYRQLNEILLESSSEKMEIQKNSLDTTFSNWKGQLEQVDDVLIVGIRI